MMRKLGQTPIEITPIGLGAWQFSEGQGFHGLFWNGLTRQETQQIVQASLDGGINWFDTAEMYGFGRSERGLSAALQAATFPQGPPVIATKWFPLARLARSISRTIDTRLANLAPYPIDLHQIHNPMALASIDAQMNQMADLVEAGKIRSIGVSNFSAQQMHKAHQALAKRGLPLAANQVKYSALDRRIERNGVLQAAKDLGVTIIAYSPLEQGLLTGKFQADPTLLAKAPMVRRRILRPQLEKSRPLVAGLKAIADDHGVTPSQVALNWLVNFHGQTVVAIPGASKVRQAEENAGAMHFTLTDEELARIDELALKL